MSYTREFINIMEELKTLGISGKQIARETDFKYNYLANVKRGATTVDQTSYNKLQKYFVHKTKEIEKTIAESFQDKDSVIIDAYKTQKNFLELSEELREAQKKEIEEKDKLIEELQKEVEKLRREIYDKLGRDLPKD